MVRGKKRERSEVELAAKEKKNGAKRSIDFFSLVSSFPPLYFATETKKE